MQESTTVFLSTIVQAAATIVAIVSGFVITRIVSLLERRNSVQRELRRTAKLLNKSSGPDNKNKLQDKIDDLDHEIRSYNYLLRSSYMILVPIGIVTLACIVVPVYLMVFNVFQLDMTYKAIIAAFLVVGLVWIFLSTIYLGSDI